MREADLCYYTNSQKICMDLNHLLLIYFAPPPPLHYTIYSCLVVVVSELVDSASPYGTGRTWLHYRKHVDMNKHNVGLSLLDCHVKQLQMLAVLLQNHDDGTQDKPYGHCLVAGVDRFPRKVTRKMGKKKIKDRSKMKAFIKVMNYNHLMPTR